MVQAIKIMLHSKWWCIGYQEGTGIEPGLFLWGFHIFPGPVWIPHGCPAFPP